MDGGETETDAPATDETLRKALQAFSDAVIPQGRRYTGVELAAGAGVDLEFAIRLRRAMGLPDVPSDEPAFFDADLDALRRVKSLMDEGVFDQDDMLHMARTLGLAAARMADAVVGLWSERFFTEEPGAESMGVVSTFAADRVGELESEVGYLVRRHLLDAVSRRLASVTTPEGGPHVAVGFADLVGFTSLSEQLSDRETAELIERFEDSATDLVVGYGGRVVKMIGDEVMFYSEPGEAGEIGLALAEAFASPDLPAVRVGAASGKVVAQGGDLFGPVVNLASRATMFAHPGTVLVSRPLADVLRDDGRYRISRLRPHRLKGIGLVDLYRLHRASD